MPITLLGLDADDTLWHNETLFTVTQTSFRTLLQPFIAGDLAGEALYATELRNLQHYGYGIKGFVLSMIETAIEVTDRTVPAPIIQQIIDLGKAMLAAPVELLDHVAASIPTLAARAPLLLLTKGDLFDQEAKLARSGLAAHFRHVEIVSDKTPATYGRLLAKYGVAPEAFLMVGNSLRSDILPVLAVGGRAVHIPYAATWAHEHVPADELPAGLVELAHLGLLPAWLDAMA
ncbi:MAG: HAD family hydrolase [Chloroflexales bacterium]|nr:HAD family hydrolase [Chloroflexales bacterium]